MKNLVVVPTYNEAENIKQIIPAVLNANPGLEILVVDDNSPDGTAKEVTDLQVLFKGRLHLLSRPGKEGLGRAYLAGFAWALERNYDGIVEMDADFSHRPCDLPGLLKALEVFDFVVGSRWVEGGSTVNWGLGRRLISRGGSWYARWVLRRPLKDWTGGFNAWRAGTLKGIQLSSIQSEGYSFQIELKYRALVEGYNGTEVPIVFEERRVGQSKMSSKIVFEALHRVWDIRRFQGPTR